MPFRTTLCVSWNSLMRMIGEHKSPLFLATLAVSMADIFVYIEMPGASRP